MPAVRPGDIISRGSRFCHAVGDRHGHPRSFQDAQVNKVIAHIADFLPPEAGLRQESFHNADFTALLLPKEINFEFPGTPRGSRRWPTRDPARLDALASQPDKAEAVPDVELLYFLLSADEHRPVREDAVHIAQEQSNAFERRVKGCRPGSGGRTPAGRSMAPGSRFSTLDASPRHVIEQRNTPSRGS